jgi:hypothetical protein
VRIAIAWCGQQNRALQPRCNHLAEMLNRTTNRCYDMSNRTGDVLRTFPPRPLNPDERALVDMWLSVACDVASAYVSERRSDDPVLYRRVVITVGPDPGPTYLVHAPIGISCWLVSSVGRGCDVQRFDSLRAALNSIRPVFELTGSGAAQ